MDTEGNQQQTALHTLSNPVSPYPPVSAVKAMSPEGSGVELNDPSQPSTSPDSPGRHHYRTLSRAAQRQQQDAKQQLQQTQQKQVAASGTSQGEEEMLAANLQETYKNILKLEVETQQGCSEVNQRLIENDAGAEITSQLWVVYKSVVKLLDHYYDFLLYALSPMSARAGKPLVINYRIMRRMWVYGVVSFLEVLKNVAAIFVEHEICACFIAYAFNILSCLTDPQLGVEGWWSEKLGDLSRMAIALYPGRYMDWKAASVYWYRASMKTQFGHGKIFYHACTVESDNLHALTQLGISVSCRDPFVPTPQYLRMVVDNVCSQRNILSSTEMAMIDFVKIHKILLLPTYNRSPEMVSLVSHYATHFGLDSSNVDFFQLRGNASPDGEKLQFWFQKSANFAICNVNHLIGFGDSRNPFAKLFGLPEALKERKDRKDRRNKKSGRSDAASITAGSDSAESLYYTTTENLDPEDWYSLLDYMNRGVMELSVRMLRQYLTGPLQTSTPHGIVVLYFMIALGKALSFQPNARPLFLQLVNKFFPWSSVIPWLNDILCVVRSNPELRTTFRQYVEMFKTTDALKYFASNESLWEVWELWGSLWFDQVAPKADATSASETGVKADIFDIPTGGPRYNPDQDGPRQLRVLILAQYLAENFPEFGLIISRNIFKYRFPADEGIPIETDARFACFCEDQRFQSLCDRPAVALMAAQADNPLDLDLWAGENEYPRLPNLESNSYGFMTEVINNEYPALRGSNTDAAKQEPTEADDEAEFQDVSTGSFQGNTQLHITGNLGDKMETSLTFISLDTNTWLKHCGRVFKCVRSGIIRLSVPLTVFQELRSLRRSTDASVADSATRAVIIIRQLYAENDIMAVRADGTKASSLNETLEFEQNQNWRSNTDEIIMKAIKLNNDLGRSLLMGYNCPVNHDSHVLTRQEAAVFRYNVLITDDRNMNLRSKAIRIANFTSSWLFEQIERVSKGRCDD